MADSNSSTGGISFCGVLFIVFLVLKLCEVIDWSWWWVFAPLWIPVGIGVGFLILAGVLYLLASKLGH